MALAGQGLLAPTATAAEVEEPSALPLGLPAGGFASPRDNPSTPEKIALGRLLYFDSRLSADDTIACSSCHLPAKAFTDNLPAAVGIDGSVGTRSAPTVINRGSASEQFWDGRAASLEEQAKGPLVNPIEMGMPSLEAVTKKVAAIAGYREFFDEVFGRPVHIDDIARAIAAFERTVVSGNSRFDRYEAGKRDALTEAELRGLAIFRSKGRCSQCHSGWNLSDEKYHNTGVGWDQAMVDVGRFSVTGREEDMGAVRTPTLREISRTAPYMKDGRFDTLEQVVDYYDEGVIWNPFLDVELTRKTRTLEQTLEMYSGEGEPGPAPKAEVQDLELTDQEKRDLVAFLKTLDGEGWREIRAPSEFPR
jgi:cytochrome c peroxidase